MLDPERERRAAEIFADVLEQPPHDRQAYLRSACLGDLELQAEVESLLRQSPEDWFLLEPPAMSAPQEAEPDIALGRRIGPYRLRTHLATGGMGSVYRAERVDDEFQSQVAVKLIRSSLADREILARFRSERQILANLQHPNIAHLLDGGSTEDGQPYIVMEYVDGRPIDRFCTEARLPVRDRLKLFLQVCEAVEYAHRCRVIHRDLKPANILVDQGGHVKLLDFGIARITAPAMESIAPDETIPMRRMLTPRYASPEQLRGQPTTITSDVYSLGVVLYELLTGITSATPSAAFPAEMERAILPSRPERPSRAVLRWPKTETGGPGEVPSRILARELKGDLDTIVLRAMSPDVDRRYPSVEHLSSDLRRYLAGLPVTARPDTVWYRLSKFAGRNRALVGAVASALVLLTGALAGMIVAFRQAVEQKREARWTAYVNAISAAESELLLDKGREAATRLQGAPAEYRGWEWRHLRGRLEQSLASWTGHEGGVTDLATTAGGRLLLSCAMDGTVKLWELPSRRLVQSWGPFPYPVESVAADRSGEVLVAGLNDGTIVSLDRSAGRADLLFRGDGPDKKRSWPCVAVRPDGGEVAAGFLDGDLALWTGRSTEPDFVVRAASGFCLPVYSPGGGLLALGDQRGWIRVLGSSRRQDLRQRQVPGGRRVWDVAISADETQLAAASMDHTVSIWDWRNDRIVSTFRGHTASVNRVLFSGDGRTAVSAGADGRLVRWAVAGGDLLAHYRGHAADVSALAATPRGDTLVSGDWSGELRLWDWETEEVPTIRHPGEGIVPSVQSAVLHPGSGTLYCALASFRISTVLLATPDHLCRGWELPRTSQFAVDPTGRRLVAAQESGELALYELASPASISAECQPESVQVASLVARALGPSGHGPAVLAGSVAHGLVASASADSMVRIWRTADLQLVRDFRIESGPVRRLAFSPDAAVLAVADSRGLMLLCRVADGSEVARIEAHRSSVTALAFCPDGSRLATAADDGSLCVWQVPSGRPLGGPVELGVGLSAVAWSHDGERLAVGGSDQVIWLVDSRTARSVARMHGHVGLVTYLEFAPNDSCLISASRDGTVRLWSASQPAPEAPTDRSAPSGSHPLSRPSRPLPSG